MPSDPAISGGAPSLSDLSDLPLWVAWREETIGGSKRKVPYSPIRAGRARADDPSTWGTRAQAAATAGRLLAPIGGREAPGGGIGIQLAVIPGDLHLGGVDLDTCRAVDGATADWALRISSSLSTYAEVSPSGRGLKLFFRYAAADEPAMLRAAFAAPNARGRKWSATAADGADHPPGVELYLGGRYFTVTGKRLGRVSGLALIGPAGIAAVRAAAEATFGTVGSAAAPTDDSRSAAAYRAALDYRRRDPSPTVDGLAASLRGSDDPAVAAWSVDKGDARQVLRLWERTAERAADLREDDGARSEADALVDEFNAKYMVVCDAGRALVLEPRGDPFLKRLRYVPIRFEDFTRLYMNRWVTVGVDGDGEPVRKKAPSVWLAHAKRRQYIGGLVFDPSGRCVDCDQYNTWRGFSYAPAAGSWDCLRAHVRDVVCRGDAAAYAYLFNTLVRVVQRPAERGEVAVVLRGKEGCGKGILLNAMVGLFGQHGFKISNAEHLTGRFNGHLQDCVVLYADEAFWAGDRKHVGILKSLITEELFSLEKKRVDLVQAKNYVHLFMASNDDWVVPASLDSRRFFVLDVADDRVGDFAYFTAIADELESGGYAAMLHDLLAADLTGFNHRDVPDTAGLTQQKKLSLTGLDRWWFGVLERGSVVDPAAGGMGAFRRWFRTVPTALLHASYLSYAASARDRAPVSREYLGRYMRDLENKPVRPYHVVVGEDRDGPVCEERAYAYTLGNLSAAREAFCRMRRLAMEWEDAAEAADGVEGDAPRTPAQVEAVRPADPKAGAVVKLSGRKKF